MTAPSPEPLSSGHRIRIALGLALTGFLTSIAILAPETRFYATPAQADLWLLGWIFGASALGAGLAGLATAELFGRPGRRSLGFAALGAALASSLGGAIGGTFIFPGFGTILGAIYVFGALVDSPLVAAIWLTGIAGTHAYALKLRGTTDLR